MKSAESTYLRGKAVVELTADRAGRRGVELLAQLQAGVGHIIIDTNGEVVLALAFEVLEHSLDHGGGEFLAAQTITASDNLHT